MIRWALVVWFALATTALALDPKEMLPDPADEERARTLDHALRCVVCQSESVASSNAPWAIEARRVVRQQVAAGQDDAAILDFFVERYGEFVLMTPRTDGANWLLWAAAPAMFLLALGLGWAYLLGRTRAPARAEQGLSPEEARRLREIMDE
ncbi:MAG: cytochrome c-type biogenesis protein [Pseudomonadota bacterium]